MAGIAGDVGVDLRHPIGGVVTGREPGQTVLQSPHVPEIPVAEHRQASLREDDVRPTGKRRHVDAVAQAELPERPPQRELASRAALPARAARGLGRPCGRRPQAPEARETGGFMTEQPPSYTIAPETVGLTIDKQLATERFGQALVLAHSDTPLPEEWLQRTREIGLAHNKTFTPVLGTALLAKATDRFVDAFSLREGESHKSYSARSLAKEVLVPCCVRAGIDIRNKGAEPLNNQPFLRADRISTNLNVKANAVEELTYLCEWIAAVEFSRIVARSRRWPPFCARGSRRRAKPRRRCQARRG